MKTFLLSLLTIMTLLPMQGRIKEHVYLYSKGVLIADMPGDTIDSVAIVSSRLIKFINSDKKILHSSMISRIDSIVCLKVNEPDGINSDYILLNADSKNDINSISTGTNTYQLSTFGNDPWIQTTALSQDLLEDSTVITFQYKCSAPTQLKAFFSPKISEARSTSMGQLQKTDEWTTFSYDLYAARNDFEWGAKGDYMRLDFGDTAGVNIEIKDIYFRAQTAEEKAAVDEEKLIKRYIDNGKIRLGVDMNHGGCIFYFARSENKTNLLNHADEGRFIQQSYYGEKDGTTWNGKAWHWNPIQGGGCDGTKPEVKSSTITSDVLDIVSTPVHWSGCYLMTDLEMEEHITLEDNVCHIHYTLRNTGPGATDHPNNSQELPAVFIDYAYTHYIYYEGANPWTNDTLTNCIPGWPNEPHNRTEEWSAYVNDKGYGIGVYTPGTPYTTVYRYPGPSGPTGSGCSYFAPVGHFAITKDMVYEYDVYLMIGNINDIRKAFYDIHNR